MPPWDPSLPIEVYSSTRQRTVVSTVARPVRPPRACPDPVPLPVPLHRHVGFRRLHRRSGGPRSRLSGRLSGLVRPPRLRHVQRLLSVGRRRRLWRRSTGTPIYRDCGVRARLLELRAFLAPGRAIHARSRLGRVAAQVRLGRGNPSHHRPMQPVLHRDTALPGQRHFAQRYRLPLLFPPLACHGPRWVGHFNRLFSSPHN